MVNKKPRVFANKIDKNIGNNNRVFYSATSDVKNQNELNEQNLKNENKMIARNINQKINDIFKSSDYVYKIDVEITLKNGIVTKKIVGKNSLYLITIENELIPISDIIDIKHLQN